MTMWLKLLPVGAADTVIGNEGSMMQTEIVAKNRARPFRSGFRKILKPSQRYLFSLSPYAIGGGSPRVGAGKENPSCARGAPPFYTYIRPHKKKAFYPLCPTPPLSFCSLCPFENRGPRHCLVR